MTLLGPMAGMNRSCSATAFKSTPSCTRETFTKTAASKGCSVTGALSPCRLVVMGRLYSDAAFSSGSDKRGFAVSR